MNKLYRFSKKGKYLGFIVADRPMASYASRTDLTEDVPPNFGEGQWPYREGGAWVLRAENA